MSNSTSLVFILRFWQAPLFEDTEQQWLANFLNRSLAVGVLFTLGIMIATAINPNMPNITLVFSLIILLSTFGVRYLLVDGKLMAAGLSVALIGWAGTTMGIIAYRGIHQPIVVLYVTIILFVGYMISWRASLHLAGLSIMTLLIIAILQETGVLNPIQERAIWYDTGIWLIGILAAMLTIRFGTQKLNNALVAVKAKNKALEEATAAADAANVAKSEFLANMSHEIRTPLNAIIGLTSLMLDTPVNNEQADYLQTMSVSGDGLLTLINDILDFSKIEAGKLEIDNQPFHLHGCVLDAVDLLASRAAEKHLALSYEIDPALPADVVGDVSRTRQILVNLLGNAVKFTEAGSVRVAVVGKEVGNGRLQLTFSVNDTGIGIPPERMNRLFQSFSQVDSSTTKRFGGTGLGLAISQRLAKAMQGEMWVESEPNVGSTFYFTAVVAPGKQVASHMKVGVASTTAVTSPPGQPEFDHNMGKRLPLRILLAEDNSINQKVGLRILERLGYQADVAGNGLEVLEALNRQPYDLVLMDVQMPEMDGVEATRKIRQTLLPEVQPIIIALTANALDGDRDTYLQAGMDDYLSKPVRIDALTAVLEHNFAKARQGN